MLNNWFYSHSVWAVAGLVCLVVVVLPLVGLHFFHRIVAWNVREEDTSMVGLSYALCGSIFAVILAFVAVVVYEAMDKSTAVASEEANSLAALIFNTAGLPDDLAGKVRGDVDQYIDIVANEEWPAQQAYHMQEKNFEKGWTQLRKVSEEISSLEPITAGQATVKTDMLRLCNGLFSARRGRLLAANEHLPNPVWQMLVVGLMLVSVFIFLFGPHSYKIHMATCAMTMLSIGLIFTLIIALDYPFRGELSVDNEAYVTVKELGERSFASTETPASPGEHTAAEEKR